MTARTTLLAFFALFFMTDAAFAQRMNESCSPDGVCIFERELRAGQIEFWVENRSERDVWVRLEFTDLYNWRSNRRLPFTGMFKAGKSKRAFRLTKPAPQEVSRKRRRSMVRRVPQSTPSCVENVGCLDVSFDDNEIVFAFANTSGQDRLVNVTMANPEHLRIPDTMQEKIKAGDADEVARIRIEDLWSEWRYGYTFTAEPVSN